MTPSNSPLVLGWREWISLPGLNVPWIKAKVDTGARSSTLHAYDVLVRDNIVQFTVHPAQDDDDTVIRVTAPLIGHRDIRSSNGEVEERPVIATEVQLLGQCHTTEITLTDRDEMGFRMLLGRTALRPHFLIDPAKSFLAGGSRQKPPR